MVEVAVFTYGTMLSLKRFNRFGVRARHSVHAVLPGFRLTFRSPGRFLRLLGGMATLDDDPGQEVTGIVHYLLMTSARRVELAELVPLGLYQRLPVCVNTAQGTLEAMTFRLRRPGRHSVPRPAYLDKMCASAKSAGQSWREMEKILDAAEFGAVERAKKNRKMFCLQRRSGDKSKKNESDSGVNDSLLLTPCLACRKASNSPLKPWQLRSPALLYGSALLLLLTGNFRHYSNMRSLLRVNPGFPGGGWLVSSKYNRVRPLLGCTGVVSTILVVPEADPAEAEARLERNGIGFPLVAKPDVGLMGRGLILVRNAAELRDFIINIRTRYVLQPYIGDPLEFAALYCRPPGQHRGMIVDLAERSLPVVFGDGQSTVAELIASNPAWKFTRQALLNSCRADLLGRRPGPGERVRLLIAARGSDGAVFSARSDLVTPELVSYLDGLALMMPGFHWGKFDFKARSYEDIKAGRNLRVLELNGTGSEVTSIFDRRVSFRQASATVAAQLRSMIEIGMRNIQYDTPAALDVIRLHHIARIRTKLAAQSVEAFRVTTRPKPDL